MPNLLQLSAPTIDDLRQKVRDEHGPLARIVSAEKVIPRGIGRVRKPTYFEAVVELPDAPPGLPPLPAVRVDPAARHGIAALLADAEDAEDAQDAQGAEDARGARGADNAGGSEDADDTRYAGFGASGAPHTRFDELMASLGSFASPLVPAPVPASQLELEAACVPEAIPVPPRVPGDLVAVVSLGEDALAIAQAMCTVFGPGELRGGGTIRARGRSPLTDRRSALLARANGVEAGTVVFCAFGVENSDDALATLAAIDADQTWLVVDAGRKVDDTQHWVNRVTSAVDVAAIAVVGAASTRTPHTVNTLGIPIGWVDAGPAAAARL